MIQRRDGAHDDRGLALVVALVVTLLVFLLTTAILADAFHNVVGSATSRNRLTAVSAAESGVSWYARSLEFAGLSSLQAGAGSAWEQVDPNTFKLMAWVEVAGAPVPGRFRVTARYYQQYANGVLSNPPCALNTCSFASMNSQTIPANLWVEVLASGTSGGSTRTVRAVLALKPSFGTLNGAFAGIFICEFGNRFTISGPLADVYVIGVPVGNNICPSANNGLQVSSGQFSTTGSVFVLNGPVDLTNTTKIDGDLWAKGSVTLGTGAQQAGNGGGQGAQQCKPQSNASVLVCGDVVSQTSDPVVKGTARVLGTWGQCQACFLPSLGFASIPRTEAEAMFPSPTWTATVSLPTLTSAALAPSVKTVAKISSCPAGMISLGTGTLYLNADLAIIADCGFSFSNKVSFRSVGGTHTLYLLTADIDPITPCTAADARNFDVQQNFSATNIRLFAYSPCTIKFRNQVNLTGQLLGKTLWAQGRTTIITADLLGLSGGQPGSVMGFQVRVLDLRET